MYPTRDDAQEAKGRDIYGELVRMTTLGQRAYKKANKRLMKLRRRSNAKGLLVAPDIATAKELQKLIGMDTPLVHSDNSGNKDNTKIINNFKEDNSPWIIAVDMIAEGVDIPKLQVVVFLSAKRTSSWLYQVIARAERRINKLLDIDENAYFFYLDDEQLNQIIDDVKIEQLKAKHKETVAPNEDSSTDGESRERRARDEFIASVTDSQGVIRIDGTEYDPKDPIFIIAVEEVCEDMDLSDFNFTIQYKIAKMLHRRGGLEIQEEFEEDVYITPQERRETLSNQCDKDLNRLLHIHFEGVNVSGKDVGEAKTKINGWLKKKIGSSKPNHTVADYEKRLRLLNTVSIDRML